MHHSRYRRVPHTLLWDALGWTGSDPEPEREAKAKAFFEGVWQKWLALAESIAEREECSPSFEEMLELREAFERDLPPEAQRNHAAILEESFRRLFGFEPLIIASYVIRRSRREIGLPFEGVANIFFRNWDHPENLYRMVENGLYPPQFFCDWRFRYLVLYEIAGAYLDQWIELFCELEEVSATNQPTNLPNKRLVPKP